MNKIITIFFLALSGVAFSQELLSPLYVSDSGRNEVNVNFKGYYHNTNLSNEFLSLFYKGGHLDTTLKNSMSDNLLTENRIGAELNYGIRYKNLHAHFLGKPEWGWYASAENIGFYHATYAENTFNLLFYGNAPYAGDTVSFSKTEFESFQYQKFTFGGFHKHNHSYIGISFLKGQNYNHLQINQADLYTALLGEEISLDMTAGLTQTDSLQKGLDAFNGWGVSTDLVFYLNVGKNRNVKFQNAFRIAIQDLGFIKWNEQSTYTEADSLYYFNGFEVNDIFDSSSFNFSDRLKDSLAVSPIKKDFTTALPFSFSFGKIADPSGEKIQGIYGFRMRAFAHYKPLFYAGLFYQPVKNLNMNVYASVGGYGKFRVGYSLYACMFHQLRLSLSSSDLIGWTKNGSGKDLSLQLSYEF